MNIPRIAVAGFVALTVGFLLVLSSARGQAPKTKENVPVGLKVDPRSVERRQLQGPVPPPADTLLTREWKVPVDLIPRIPPPAAATPGLSGISGLADREAAKKWLIEKGIVFQGQASAVYITRSSRLIVRNTRDQLDLIDVLIEKSIPSEPALEKKAGETVIPKLEMKEATPAEAFQAISAATGIPIFYTPVGVDEARITVSLTNIPASEALKYVTSLADLKATYAKDGVHIGPK